MYVLSLTALIIEQVSAHWRLPVGVVWLLVICSLLLPVRFLCVRTRRARVSD